MRKKRAAYIGRFCPIHRGHQRVINTMIDDYSEEESLILLGSCNTPQSMRHFFSYQQRCEFIQKLYPNIKLIGIPDYPTDEEWLYHLDHQLIAAGFELQATIFYGGNTEDVQFFIDASRRVKILDRFDESVLPILSAQRVRHSLVSRESRDKLIEFIDERVVDEIQSAFGETWVRFEMK